MSKEQIEEVAIRCDRCGKPWNNDSSEPFIMLSFYNHRTRESMNGNICGDCESVFFNLMKLFLSGAVDKEKKLSYDEFLVELGNTGEILEEDLRALYSAYVDDSATE